jgi:Carbohydrate family 9 binding domain-like
MSKKLFFTALAACLGLSVTGGNMKLLSFYTANYTSKAPSINGKLDDACWEKAQVYNTYYVYFKPNPIPGKLKTEFRMLYDSKGIYLAIVNYEKNLDKVRKKYTVRDASKLWTDDCAEIYFDPYCDGVGFTKFVVNAGGIIGDMRRIDAAVSLPDWNGSAWNAAVDERKNAWVIEAFFPWRDLGGRVETGSLWKFCHVRYAWSTGKFIGVSSSPGGCYNNPENFGFIYFAGTKPVGSVRIGKLLAKKATPPWCLQQGDSLLVCDSGNKVKLKKLSELIKSASSECEKLIEELKKLNPDVIKSAKTGILKQQKTSFANYRALEKLKSQLLELHWKLKLNKLITNIK